MHAHLLGAYAHAVQLVHAVIKRHPCAVLLPTLLCLVLLIALGTFGAFYGAQSEENTRRHTADAVALDAAVAFTISVERVGTHARMRMHACSEQSPAQLHLC